ncbi:hypothetical protein GPECTOR_358g126 [Gonium pectorale]|uniref:Conserved oligomeric Golgi complex subunit 4 n=1 Tax=Gonium pectorale TaxID=33097 RepID=A0A150FVJ0_GONPE|nr:hypothetical protein GPECTOR_358g126 [Gonium pectorale]|eukprot:KXZ41619.1 hypothetical protein GPECTOR_358g126 [Gonium pectorale]
MATAVDVNVIYKLTNIADVTRLLNETVARERAIDQDLDRQLSKRSDLERNFLLLNTPTAETLELVRADCEQLLQSVQSTAQLADSISSKVRQLDLVQGRVQGVLNKINLILDRTNCINGVQSAMETEDYEAAAHYISSFMELENRMAAALAAAGGGSSGGAPPPQLAADASQAEDQRRILLEVRAKLEDITEKRFQEAVAKRDHAAALRFARLYKPLGKQAEGLQRFIEYLKVVVGAQARNAYNSLAEQLEGSGAGARGGRVDFAAALTSLFKDMALCLEEHEPLVRETFGDAALLECMAGLQAECDNAGSRILQRFSESRRLERVVREVTSRRRGAPGASSGSTAGSGVALPFGVGGGGQQQPAGEPSMDHRAVEGLIEELLRICGLCEEYNQFMLGKMRAAAGVGGLAASANGRESSGGAPATGVVAQLPAAREAAFRSGSLNVSLRELLGRYVALEEYYLDETAALAIRLDEALPGALTSSMVDDVFYILRKVGLRALAAGQFHATAALLAELNNVLANSFRNALQAKLAAGPSKMLAALPASLVGAALDAMSGPLPAVSEWALVLNNTDVAADYAAKLRAELEGHTAGLLAAPADRDKARSVLSDLAKTGSDFRSLAARGLEAAAEGLLPRLRQLMDEVAAASYTLSEAEYSASEAEGGWPGRLVMAMGGLAAAMRPHLTAANWEVMFGMLLDKVSARLEGLLLRKPFNQLGGLALDRDVRLLVGGLAELTSRTVRDRLARLSQMAVLLGLETAEELLDYWGPGSGGAGGAGAGVGVGGEAGGGGVISWRLSAAEVYGCPQVRKRLLQNLPSSDDAAAAIDLLVRSLLQLGAALKPQARFLLSAAAAAGDTRVLRTLLRSGVDAGGCGGRALVAAAAAGQLGSCQLLLAAGVSARAENGMPLRAACREGQVAAARLLLAAGADPRAAAGAALAEAARGGHLVLVLELLGAGADPRVDGSRALVEAAAAGHGCCVLALLVAGAQPGARGGEAARRAAEGRHDTVPPRDH